MKDNLTYNDWIDDVYFWIEELAGVCRSDAQGLADANELKVNQCWRNGIPLNAIDTAKKIINNN